MFRRMLLACRGAMAVRIAQTCRELGIRTVAVHSKADIAARAVQLADESFDIGLARDDHKIHLAISALISAAMVTGADAIHPGCGPLARDPSFAEVCADYGITFIGPGPALLERLDDRVEIRRLMHTAGLPLMPGSEALSSFRETSDAAQRLGYPVLLRPVSARSGIARALVRRPEELEGAFEAGRRLAGKNGLYLEQFLAPNRHVEVQVLCDQGGRGVHLGERDCSLRWQDQRLIVESPSIHLGPEQRRELCGLAVRGALAAGYSGAGTVEFLIQNGGRFAFAGMTAQVQAEHPVTELTSGIDIVREQIRIAADEPLRFTQDDIRPRGHALGCHIKAEDPDRAFTPDYGVIRNFIPAGGPGTRFDTYLHPGCPVPPFYDPLVAKLAVWAEDRPGAIDRMARALAETTVEGVKTTIPFLRRVCSHRPFRDGDFRIDSLPMV